MILVTTALILGLGAQQAVEPERQSKAPQTDQTVPATRGARLTVNNFAGEVNIRTWERDALRVQAVHSARTKVSIQTTPSGMSLNASGSMGPPGAVDYTITAPAWMPIKACSPVAWSTGENGLRTGGPSRSPVIASMPQKACRITS